MPLVAFRERLPELAKLLLPIGQLAVALEHLEAMRLDETSRFGGCLLALLELGPQLREVAFVRREQLALSVDVVLALVKRQLEGRPGGTHVVSVLLEPAAQRLDIARQRRHLFALPRRDSVLLFVAMAQVVAQVLDLGGQLDEAVLALRKHGSGALTGCGGLPCRAFAGCGSLARRAFARGGVAAPCAGGPLARPLSCCGLRPVRARGLQPGRAVSRPPLASRAAVPAAREARAARDAARQASCRAARVGGAARRRNRAAARDRPAAVPPEAFSVSINASRSLSSRRSAVKRSWYSLICASICSALARQKLTSFFVSFSGPDSAISSFFFSCATLTRSASATSSRCPACCSQRVRSASTLSSRWERTSSWSSSSVFGARLRCSCSSRSDARASDSLSAFCSRAKACSAKSRGLAIARPK